MLAQQFLFEPGPSPSRSASTPGPSRWATAFRVLRYFAQPIEETAIPKEIAGS